MCVTRKELLVMGADKANKEAAASLGSTRMSVPATYLMKNVELDDHGEINQTSWYAGHASNHGPTSTRQLPSTRLVLYSRVGTTHLEKITAKAQGQCRHEDAGIRTVLAAARAQPETVARLLRSIECGQGVEWATAWSRSKQCILTGPDGAMRAVPLPAVLGIAAARSVQERDATMSGFQAAKLCDSLPHSVSLVRGYEGVLIAGWGRCNTSRAASGSNLNLYLFTVDGSTHSSVVLTDEAAMATMNGFVTQDLFWAQRSHGRALTAALRAAEFTPNDLTELCSSWTP